MSDEFFNDDDIWREDFFIEETPYCTRDQNGVIVYHKTIEDAVANFMSYDGYRLSIETDNFSLFIHRDELPIIPNAKPGSIAFDGPIGIISYDAKVQMHLKDR